MVPNVINIDTLAEHTIIAWIVKNEIKNEKGDPIEFRDRPYLYDIYLDQSQLLAVVKCAQCGLSTCEIIKNHYDAKSRKMDIIYTLPTDNDVNVFVGGKVNRIIANNPCMLADVKDKDSIEQKAVGPSMIYFRGTWTAKSAIMIAADRLVHDEKDSSKQEVVEDYKSRLDSPSSLKQRHTFSHPSFPGQGVDVEWQKSDMKEWFIKCPHCQKEQYLSWSTIDASKMSVDLALRQYVCKKCHGVLSDDDRRRGRWVARHKRTPERPYSGYHISQLMAPRISGAEICDKWALVMDGKQTEEYFYNKVLGIPFAGSGNAVLEETILGAVTADKNLHTSRIVIGVDTGIKLRYVIGNKAGLLGYGEMIDYIPDEVNKLPLEQTLEYFLKKFETAIMVIDQGGDIIGSRKLQKKYPGRVFLCHYRRDRATQQLIRWGEKDEFGTVLADRNRMIQLVIDEYRDGRVRLYNGTKAQWHDFWLHWSHIYRTVEVNNLGVREYEWHRSDRDDWVHANVYYRIGIDRFGDSGAVVGVGQAVQPNSYMIDPDGKARFDPQDLFFKAPDDDEEMDEWR